MWTSALVFGLLGSFHCLGMCGPIAFMLPLDRENRLRGWAQLSLYHLGRLTAYGTIGLAFGFLGRGLALFGFQQKLSLGIGLLMVLLVLVPGATFQGSRFMAPLHRGLGKLRSALGDTLGKRSPDAFLTLGLLNGFLPCGLVYMALLGALAMAAPLQGGFYMLLFGLGTVPMMSLVAFSKGLLKPSLARGFKKLIPIFVVLIGVLFILRGLGLGIPYVSPAAVQPHTVEAKIECP